MCWNESVSLNTFVFGMGVLMLIAYNNAFTNYKVSHFDSIYVYLFYVSFVSMQLVEYFIWRNLTNVVYNHLFSLVGAILLFLQPISSIMLITTNVAMRNRLIMSYLTMAVPYGTYKLYTGPINSSVSKMGHLRWNFLNNAIVWIVWLFFFLFSFFVRHSWSSMAAGISLLAVAFVNFRNDNSMGSMWCWLANSSMIYWATYILLYLPFYKHKSVC